LKREENEEGKKLNKFDTFIKQEEQV